MVVEKNSTNLSGGLFLLLALRFKGLNMPNRLIFSLVPHGVYASDSNTLKLNVEMTPCLLSMLLLLCLTAY